jgi:hypothetical protein
VALYRVSHKQEVLLLRGSWRWVLH